MSPSIIICVDDVEVKEDDCGRLSNPSTFALAALETSCPVFTTEPGSEYDKEEEDDDVLGIVMLVVESARRGSVGFTLSQTFHNHLSGSDAKVPISGGAWPVGGREGDDVDVDEDDVGIRT